MGSVDIFEVLYDSEQAVYREGDKVTGLVRIQNTEPLKYKAIKVELCGVAVVRWNKPDSYSDEERDDEDFSGDCNKEQYFHKKIPLLGKDGSFLDKAPVLEEGEHIYPFECQLPPELPSSFEGKYGRVRYFAKAVIERPWKSNVVTKKCFTVISGLDLNFIPEAASKIELCKYKSMDGCCASLGSITIDWTVDKSGFVPGENIYIDGAIQNESKANVSFSRVILYMAVDYKSGKRKRREYQKINSAEKGETCADDVTVWQESIHIPPVPPTGLSRCKLIDINYELHFTAAIEGRKNPIRYIKDIYIGTVPMCRKEMKSCIAGMYNQPYLESTEGLDELHRTNASQLSLTHIVAVASAIQPKTSPTAPSLTSMDGLPSSNSNGVIQTQPLDVAVISNEDRPPPFAPGSSGAESKGSKELGGENKAAGSSDTGAGSKENGAVATGSGLTSETEPLNPSAPGTRTLLRPYQDTTDGVTPSFEATEWGPVSIRDRSDDSESLRGEFTYSPVYTYYNTIHRPHSN